jgi:hypothetical protein
MPPRDHHLVPEVLYKYKPWGKFAQEMIRGRIYFATAKELNDPFEYRYRMESPKDLPDALIMAREMTRMEWPHLADDSDEQRAVYEALERKFFFTRTRPLERGSG